MKKMLRAAAAMVLAGCMMTANVFAATPTFTDVPTTYWGHSFITKAAQSGLVSGLGDGTYGVAASLSNAQFTTMVCNLLYKSEVTTYQNTYKPTEWWRAYMAVAYEKGILKNTTVGDSRAVSSSWSTSAVNAQINRYDMAQIMTNVAGVENWGAPTTAELLAAQNKIGDWNKIPSKYQAAVASAYAKGYLSGMDDGTFSGDVTMNRTMGAVVLCKLMDAKTAADKNAVTTPTYTNTVTLVNGKTPTQDNVSAALKALKAEFPNNAVWDMSKSYKSVNLGNGTGRDAFAFMLADRVFGNLALNTVSAEELKPGDIIHLRSGGFHIVVESVDDDEFTYVTCNSAGKVSWGMTYDMDDLTAQDTIYSRYKDTSSSTSGSSNGKLSNGKAVTVANVKALIAEFLDEEYDDGDDWDDSYRSASFGGGKVTDSQAFAYYMSDYIFGDLKVEEVDDFDDLQVGDVVYWDDDEEYFVITKISGDTIDYIGVWNDEVYTFEIDVDDLDSKDEAYTRYTGTSSGSSSSTTSDGKLSNGKEATVSNVKALITKFLDEKYDEGDEWDNSHRSPAFNNGRTAYDNEAFAYYLSDYIFGDLEATELTDFDDLRVGDVIYSTDLDEYIVVTKISGGEISYISVWDEEVYEGEMDEDYLSTTDTAYTRYPDATEKEAGKLTNGKAVTVANVLDLIEDFQIDEYTDGDKWDDDKRYKSREFSSSYVYKDEAFAYYFSDYIFDGLEVYELDDFDDIRAGDVIHYVYATWEEYLVVLDVDGDDITVMGVDDEEVYISALDVDDLGSTDTAYSRYTDLVEKDALSNGKSVTSRNVMNLISEFLLTQCDEGDAWADNKQYRSTAFSTRYVSGDQAFTYFLSDYIFGDLKIAKVSKPADLRVGDVIYYKTWEQFMVITKITGDELDLIGVYREKVDMDSLDIDDLDFSKGDYAYTRYPS